MLATQRLTDLSITESVPSAELETSMRAVDWLTAIALSVVASTAQEALTRMADVGTIVVKCWAGRILVGVGLWLIVLALGANIFARFFPVNPPGAEAQMTRGNAGNPTPPVKGFAKGEEIRFIHTEASDPQVAAMLTRMMGPKVLVVPSLKQIHDRLLASVFVFQNGVKDEGPMGFQPDVFDAVPGEPATRHCDASSSSRGKTHGAPGCCVPLKRFSKLCSKGWSRS